MSFRASLIFEICLVVFLSFSKKAAGVYENNPFLQGVNRPVPAVPAVTHTPVVSTDPKYGTTKEPTFTIEPPEILYGHDLNRKCLKPRGQFPSSSCKKYVNCWDGVAIEQSCLGNFLFNPIKLYCDYPENVDCKGKPSTIKATPASAAIPSEIISTPSSVLGPTTDVTAVNSQSSGLNPSLRTLCLRSTGLFPGSTCSKFVNCWDDNAVEQDCPTGLYFSSEGYCDYPERVQCDKLGDDGEIPSRVNTRDSNCPLEFGNFRNRKDCSQYYTCSFYKVVAQYKCPEGFRFSDILGVCDYLNRVDCSKEPQFIDIRGIQAKDSDCPLEFGNFRNRNNCSQYYTCAFYRVAARYDCPEGLSFSDLLGICDYSYRVDCTKEPQIFQKNNNAMQALSFNAFAHPDLSIPAPGDSRCIVNNGIVRDQGNCSSYYVCEHGTVAANYICPTGFKFSNELGICDYEEKVDCNSPRKAFEMGSTNVLVPNIPTEVLSQVQKCVPGSVFRLNPQCTGVCRCRNGEAEIIQCSSGLAYDSTTDKCVLPHLAKC